MTIANLIDGAACALILYVAAWVFLVQRDYCRRKYGGMSGTFRADRTACTIGAAVAAVLFAAFAIGAIIF